MAIRMTIPTPYIFTIDTPLIILRNRIFQPSQKTDGNDNYLELNPTKYSLEEIATAQSLEETYFRHNSELFERYQSRYISENIKKDLMSTTNLKEEVTKNKVLSFIVNDVLPLITAEKLDNEIEEILVDDKLEQESQHRRHSRSSRTNGHGTHAREMNGTTDGATEREANEVPISREILAETRRMKNEFLKKLDQEYAQYEKKGKPRSRNTSIDDRLSDILQPTTRRRANTGPRYPTLDDDSIFTQGVSSQDMMFIGNATYDIVSVKEFISYFKDYMKPELYRSLMSFGPKKDPSEINDFIRQNIFDMDKKCRSRIRNKLRSSMLKIDGEYFIPFLKEDSAQFRNTMITNYSKLIEKKIKAESFEKYEGQTREIYDIAEERKRLHKLFESSSYERKGAGFKTIGGEYYVYVTTPRYALRSPHVSGTRRYVEFPPATIGVKVRNNGYGFEFGDPEIMSKYKHPFLGDALAHQKICLGSTGSQVANNFRRLSPEQTVLALLDQGKKTLMMGYKTGSNPYPSASLYESNGWTFITKQDVERKGLVCLNEGW